MVFQVYDQGRGLETPWQTVFPPRGVRKLAPTAATKALSDKDQLKHSAQAEREADLLLKGSGGQRSMAERYQQVADDQKGARELISARQIMSAPVQSLLSTASVTDAQKVFAERRFRHLPVVDESGLLLGIVSDRDVLSILPEMRKTLITEIMISPVLTASADTEITELARVMVAHRIGAMPLLEDGKLLGMVTRTDMLRTLMVKVPLEFWL